MKKVILFVLATVLMIAMCACGNKQGTDKPDSSTSTQSTTQEPADNSEQGGSGDLTDDYPTPAGATDEISQGTFYYDLVALSGDSGDGLTPAEGAKQAEQLLISMNVFGDTGLPQGQCLYIAFDEIVALDSAMGRECFIYTVGTGTPEGGFKGDDYEVIYRVSVDYSGTKTAAVYDDFSDGHGEVFE